MASGSRAGGFIGALFGAGGGASTSAEDRAAEGIRGVARPVTGDAHDFDPILEVIGPDKTFVLIGEGELPNSNQVALRMTQVFARGSAYDRAKVPARALVATSTSRRSHISTCSLARHS